MHGRWRELARDFPRVPHAGQVLRLSAVGIVVTVTPDGVVSFLLTRRTAGLRNHPGQFALPGGKIEPDETAESCALREVGEELGLHLSADAVVGVLDDYATRSGFVITPVVLWAGEDPVELHPDPGEVADVFTVPVADLGVAPILVPIVEAPNPVLRLPLMGAFVHAPTGAILWQFGELAMHARVTRVAHFEQPVFAWR